jgi:uncharacterized damage-inducible protein DinB
MFMNYLEPTAVELQREAATARKLLERVPEDSLSWKPHEKSMTLGRLAGHIAELPSLIVPAVTQDELDFAAGAYVPFAPSSVGELVEKLDKTVAAAVEVLNKPIDEESLSKPWRLRNGEQVFFEAPRLAAIRSLAINHFIHHRGQLSVYLRLLDVPIPSIYGPTADEQM